MSSENASNSMNDFFDKKSSERVGVDQAIVSQGQRTTSC